MAPAQGQFSLPCPVLGVGPGRRTRALGRHPPQRRGEGGSPLLLTARPLARPEPRLGLRREWTRVRPRSASSGRGRDAGSRTRGRTRSGTRPRARPAGPRSPRPDRAPTSSRLRPPRGPGGPSRAEAVTASGRHARRSGRAGRRRERRGRGPDGPEHQGRTRRRVWPPPRWPLCVECLHRGRSCRVTNP